MTSVVVGDPLTSEPLLAAQTIPGYLAAVCEQYAECEALVMRLPDGSLQRWRYRDLQATAGQIAAALIASGVDRGTRVGVLMANRSDYLGALFGIAAAGGVSVALNTFSTAPELEQQLNQAAVSVLLFDERLNNQNFALMLSELGVGPAGQPNARFPYLRECVWLPSVTSVDPPLNLQSWMTSWSGFLDRAHEVDEGVVSARCRDVHPSDPAGIYFSSGTTSTPKAIVHSQRAYAIQWSRCPRIFAVGEGARTWTGNGFFWSANIAMAVGCALSSGGAVIIQPVFDAEIALELIERERISFLMGRPHQWARLRDADGWSRADLSSLKQITKGEIIVAHPTVDTDWQVPNAFGTTETLALCTAFDANTSAADYAGSFGAPLPGNTLKIVDPLSGHPVAVGERGEICIKGPTLMLGYLGKPPEDCFDDGGYYRTGDGGYVDALGRLYWEGRLTDIIKCGGANVSPDEVDAAIAAFPGVRRCQTVGIPDELLGERVVSCIVAADGSTIDAEAVVVFLRQRLASYKLPRQILFFDERDFDLTANEKVKTAELRERVLARLATMSEQETV